MQYERLPAWLRYRPYFAAQPSERSDYVYDPMVVVELPPPSRGTADRALRDLLSALLTQALKDLGDTDERPRRDLGGLTIREGSWSWLFHEPVPNVPGFTFEDVCAGLGLHVDATREGVLRMLRDEGGSDLL